MTVRTLIVASLLSLCASASASERGADWQIGPEIHGKNYSVGVPSVMSDSREGPAFDFPISQRGQVKYVTMRTGSLSYARSMTITYRIDATSDTRFIPNERPSSPAILSLYFQRGGDNWSAKGKFSSFRWYSSLDKTLPLSPGEHTITVDMVDDWIPVVSEGSEDIRDFRAALQNAERVGFVMGWSGGRGHGVHATKPARFILLDFRIR